MLHYLRLYPLSLAVLLLVALVEKGLFALYHSAQFSSVSVSDSLYAILWGIKFDLAISGAFAFFAFFIAYLAQRLLGRDFAAALQHTTFITAAILLLLHGSDMLYFEEAGRHLGYELKEGINSGGDLATAALLTYTAPVALQLSLLLPLFLLNRRLFRRVQNHHSRHPQQTGWMRTIDIEMAVVASLLAGAVLARGGIGSVPLEPLHVQEIGNNQQATLALNGAYNAVFSSVTPYSIRPVFAQPPGEQALALLRQMYGSHEPAAQGTAHHYNVVMVLLESWSGAYMQPYGYDKQTTPYFDSLRHRSFAPMATVAGGHRTTEGIFSTMCSWQNPLGQTVAQSQLQNYEYHCLPELLGKHGYHTAFFQGTLKNTSGTGAFAQLLGFEKSYGKKDVKDYRYPHNSWGLQDPDLYRFTLKQLKQMPQPFFVGINSNSTHSSELPPGVAPHFSGSGKELTYSNMLHFSDTALREFIEAVEKEPALQNTIFVLVADHAGPSRGDSILNNYLIPFLIYAPGIVEPRQPELVSSQRDIAPSLLSLLNIERPSAFSGTSLFDEPERVYADYYHHGTLGWIAGNRGIEFPVNGASPAHCYQFDAAPFRRQQITCDDSSKQLQRQATAFTHVSQSLLFSGSIDTFGMLIED